MRKTRIVHFEDIAFNGGSRELYDAIQMIEKMKYNLSGAYKESVNLYTKWDGAPAIICGVLNERFFVSTKAAFNTDPKICYTSEDIDKFYTVEDIRRKLKVCLVELSRIGIEGIVQGDFLFEQSDLKEKFINGERCITFKANTITYTVPIKSPLAERIMKSKLGICFHTRYNSLEESGTVTRIALESTERVWIPNPEFNDISGTVKLTSAEISQLEVYQRDLNKEWNRVNKLFVDSVASSGKFNQYLNRFINIQVKNREKLSDFSSLMSSFSTFLNNYITEERRNLKTGSAKSRREELLNSFNEKLQHNRQDMLSLFKIHLLLRASKEVLINSLDRAKQIDTYLETKEGFIATGSEGFVAVDNSGKTIKLVDRFEFSFANFNLTKW